MQAGKMACVVLQRLQLAGCRVGASCPADVQALLRVGLSALVRPCPSLSLSTCSSRTRGGQEGQGKHLPPRSLPLFPLCVGGLTARSPQRVASWSFQVPVAGKGLAQVIPERALTSVSGARPSTAGGVRRVPGWEKMRA